MMNKEETQRETLENQKNQSSKRRTDLTNFWTKTREVKQSQLPSWKGGLSYNTAAGHRADRTLDWLNKIRDRSLASSKLRALKTKS